MPAVLSRSDRDNLGRPTTSGMRGARSAPSTARSRYCSGAALGKHRASCVFSPGAGDGNRTRTISLGIKRERPMSASPSCSCTSGPRICPASAPESSAVRPVCETHVRGTTASGDQVLAPGTSASSPAKTGSSGGMSQPPPGTILLYVGMRDMVTRAACTGPGRHVGAKACG